jgi:hypothetical protein
MDLDKKQPLVWEAVFSALFLPADQSKYGNAKGKQPQDNIRDPHTQRPQTIEEKEQNQTPGCDRMIESHFSLL